MPAKRTPEEIWSALEKEALDDEQAKRAASVTPDEAARRLAEAGVDVHGVRAEARAFREEMARRVAARRAAQERTAKASRRPQRRTVVWLVAAALGVAAGGGLLYARLSRQLPPAPVPPAPTPTAPAPEPSNWASQNIAAEGLRREAYARCDASDWIACLDRLDEAARIDPAGDAAPDVREARRKATNGLRASPAPTNKLNPPR